MECARNLNHADSILRTLLPIRKQLGRLCQWKKLRPPSLVQTGRVQHSGSVHLFPLEWGCSSQPLLSLTKLVTSVFEHLVSVKLTHIEKIADSLSDCEKYGEGRLRDYNTGKSA